MDLPCSIQEKMKEVLEKSKTATVYTITDKLSGQTLGYAFMLSDSSVSLDQVQLLPWQAPQSRGEIPPDREGESGNRDLAPGSLASDLNISDDSSANSTVEEGLSVSGQEILDVSNGSRVNNCNDVTEATQIDVDDDTKLSANDNNNWNSTASPVLNSGTSNKSLAQTFAVEIASKLAAEKRAASRNVGPSVMDNDSFGSNKSSRELLVKRKYDQSVPGKFYPGNQSRYAEFFTDVGVSQPKDYRRGRLVRCLLCGKEIGSHHFGRHLRVIHEPSVELPGKFSPGNQSSYGAFYTDVGVTQPQDYKKGKLVRCLLCKKEIGLNNIGRHLRKIHEPFVEIASKLAAEKRAASRDELPEKFSPGIQSRYAAFFTDVGVIQPENLKHGKLVRCLLCNKEIGSPQFRRHLRLIHEPPVECDNCGGEFSSQRITVHRKICTSRSFKTQEMRVKEPKVSIIQLKSENREVKVKPLEMRAQESRLSEKQLKSKNKEAKFKLISIMTPDIHLKVTLKRNVKIKKAMKIFADKFNVNRKKLSFVMSGVKLTGDELVSELEGGDIIVHGKVS